MALLEDGLELSFCSLMSFLKRFATLSFLRPSMLENYHGWSKDLVCLVKLLFLISLTKAFSNAVELNLIFPMARPCLVKILFRVFDLKRFV